jgi:hypothetical protein
MGNAAYTAFSDAIASVIDNGKDAPCHRRVPKSKRLPNDLCAGKHGGNTASALAFEKSRRGHSEMFETLREVFHAHGELTSKEVAGILGLPDKNKFAPRLSDMLIRTHELERTGEMRNGAYVLRLVR